MRKFLKACLIAGVICIVAGIAASAAGINAGSLAELKNQILNGEWSVDLGNIDLEVAPFYELEEQEYFDDKETLYVGDESVEAAFETDSLLGIYVKGAGVAVEFVPYDGSRPELTDGDDVVVCASKIGKYQCFVRDHELHIIVSGKSETDLAEGRVQIMLPQEVLDAGRLDVTVEASAATIDFGEMQAAEVRLEVSAGTITWTALAARELEIDMTAGLVSGQDTIVAGITEIDMKAGSVELAGTFGSEVDISVSTGKVSMELNGAFSDYNYDLSCAAGSLIVGEEKLEGIAKGQKINNNSAKNMDIECSAGAVNIRFAN